MRKSAVIGVVCVLCLGVLALVGVAHLRRARSLRVAVDLPAEEAKLARFMGGSLQFTPETIINYEFILADSSFYEGAIGESNKALAMFPNDLEMVSFAVPTAARCYALLGREDAGLHYLRQTADRYRKQRTVLKRGLTLSEWLDTCATTQKAWAARREGDYRVAAKWYGEAMREYQRAREQRNPDIADVHAIVGILIEQARLLEASGDTRLGAEVYERARDFAANPPFAGLKTVGANDRNKKRILDAWSGELPARIARCRKPPAEGSVEAALGRVDWLVEDGRWQVGDGQNYPRGIAELENALSTLGSTDLSKLGPERAAVYAGLRERELPRVMKEARQAMDNWAKARSGYRPSSPKALAVAAAAVTGTGVAAAILATTLVRRRKRRA